MERVPYAPPFKSSKQSKTQVNNTEITLFLWSKWYLKVLHMEPLPRKQGTFAEHLCWLSGSCMIKEPGFRAILVQGALPIVCTEEGHNVVRTHNNYDLHWEFTTLYAYVCQLKSESGEKYSLWKHLFNFRNFCFYLYKCTLWCKYHVTSRNLCFLSM